MVEQLFVGGACHPGDSAFKEMPQQRGCSDDVTSGVEFQNQSVQHDVAHARRAYVCSILPISDDIPIVRGVRMLSDERQDIINALGRACLIVDGAFEPHAHRFE